MVYAGYNRELGEWSLFKKIADAKKFRTFEERDDNLWRHVNKKAQPKGETVCDLQDYVGQKLDKKKIYKIVTKCA